MKRRIPWVIAIVALLVVGALVLRTLKARRAAGAPPAPAAAASAAALDLAPADVVVVRPVELVRTLTVSGGLKAVNTAVVKAKISAELKSLTVREGDPVRAGQVIGQLDPLEAELRVRQAAQTAQSARAQLDIAQRTLDNNRALVEQGFISPTGLETSVANHAAAEASYRAAVAAADLARKSVGDARLVAPLSGIVSQRLAQPGERVPLDGRIVEIVDLSRIELEAAVAPEDVGSIAVGNVARLQVDGLNDTVEGRVARINPSTQAGTRSVMVYIALDPRPGLRQGLFARGTIELLRRQALAVPLSVVRVEQSRPTVLAVENGVVVQRIVTPGTRGEATFGGLREPAVELLDGLAAGTPVLRSTVGTMRPGTRVALSDAAASAVAPASPPAPPVAPASLPAASAAR